MEVNIKGDAAEIAALVLAVQERQSQEKTSFEPLKPTNHSSDGNERSVS